MKGDCETINRLLRENETLYARVAALTAERDALRAALLTLTKMGQRHSFERRCCASISAWGRPHEPDCAAMAALRQGGE